MQHLSSYIFRYDWLLLGAVFLLMALGLLSLFSLQDTSSFPYFERQLWWALVGTILLLSVSFVDFRLFRSERVAVLILYFGAVILLAAVLIGGFAVRGVEAWLKFGSLSFQPVEAAKLALVILLAKFFSKRHIEIYRARHLLISGLYAAVPVALVILQPDLGSALILVTIWLAVVLFSGMKLRHFAVFLLFLSLVSVLGWSFALAPYQKARIFTFFNPYADPQGAGYQMIQSMIAVGSGRVWGKGLGYGSQSHLNFLPEAETDFIFAAFAEEWGFVGVLIMLPLFFLVIGRTILIGIRASDNFSRLYALGFAALVFSQTFIHIGMNMGALPITGITLPFVSYGGSSLVTLLAGVGILQNIRINARRAVAEGGVMEEGL